MTWLVLSVAQPPTLLIAQQQKLDRNNKVLLYISTGDPQSRTISPCHRGYEYYSMRK